MDLKFDYTDEIVSVMQSIAKLEGEMRGVVRSFQDEDTELSAEAAIEAVHYSTKIEGNPLTLAQVTTTLKGGAKTRNPNRNVKEIVNYAKARRMVIDQSQSGGLLTNKFILKLHSQLLSGILQGKLKGHYREGQNAIKDSATRKLIYLPPEWGEVSRLMKQLIRWTNASLYDDKSPLIVSALFHFQFVTIHPFMDGNGRLARLLSNFILLANDFTVSHYSAIEKQHEKNRRKYYGELRKLQGRTFYDIPKTLNTTSWVSYYLGCLEQTYQEALSRLGSLQSESNSELPERLKLALGFFKKHSTLKAVEYESILPIGRTQAVADLKKLTDLGLIERIGGGRSTRYRIVKTKKETPT